MNRTTDKREIALDRASELKSKIQDYLDIKDSIPNGMRDINQKKALKKKETLLSILDASEDDWNDYHWQLKNRISDVNTLTKVIDLTDEEIESIKTVSKVTDGPYHPIIYHC